RALDVDKRSPTFHRTVQRMVRVHHQTVVRHLPLRIVVDWEKVGADAGYTCGEQRLLPPLRLARPQEGLDLFDSAGFRRPATPLAPAVRHEPGKALALLRGDAGQEH